MKPFNSQYVMRVTKPQGREGKLWKCNVEYVECKSDGELYMQNVN